MHVVVVVVVVRERERGGKVLICETAITLFSLVPCSQLIRQCLGVL